MEEAIEQIKLAISSKRTDIVTKIISECEKFGEDGKELKDKILRQVILPEGTLLHYATILGNQDIVRSLLSLGADPTIENKQGDNPYDLVNTKELQFAYVGELFRSVGLSDIPRIDKLLKAGINPNSWDCDEKRNSLLHWAVNFANKETILFLLEKGSDANSLTVENVTPLHDAVERNDLEIIEILLKYNASPLIKAKVGKLENISALDLGARKPEVFSLMSRYLALNFTANKNVPVRATSIDSVCSNGGIESESLSFMQNNGKFSPAESIENRIVTSSNNFLSLTHSGFDSPLEGVVRGLELKAPVHPIVTDSNLSNLWPQPKSLIPLEGLHFYPEKVIYVSILKSFTNSVHEILDIFTSYNDVFDELGIEMRCSSVHEYAICELSKSTYIESQLFCSISPEALSLPNSYKIHITSQRIMITGADILGLRYAVCTLIQLLTLYLKDESGGGIPPMSIYDHASLKHRGVFLDISQERIPKLSYLITFIKSLSLFKINYLHLHLRFDKTGLPSSYSRGEILAIDRQCKDLGIILVPAIDISPLITKSEYMLSVKSLISELLPYFPSSRYINIGPQLTKLILEADSSVEGFAGFSKLWDYIPIVNSDISVMLCNNAVNNAIKEKRLSTSHLINIPSNVILLDYGFQADYNFGSTLQELSKNGCSSMIMGGTSAWSSLAGCPEAALCNLFHAATNGVENSCLGLIVANWSGCCSMIPKIFAWPGFILAAGLSWNHNTHWGYLQGSLANLISIYILKDSSGLSGQAVIQLGCGESNLLRSGLNQSSIYMTNLPPSEGTTLYQLLTNPNSVQLDFLNVETFVKCVRSVKKCQALLLESKIVKQHNPIYDELCLTIELMLLSCRIGRSLLNAGLNPRSNMGLNVINLGISNLSPTVRSDIANKLLSIIEEYQRVWMLQNYSTGIEASLYGLTSVLQQFIPDCSKLISGRLSSSSSMSNGHSNYS